MAAGCFANLNYLLTYVRWGSMLGMSMPRGLVQRAPEAGVREEVLVVVLLLALRWARFLS